MEEDFEKKIEILVGSLKQELEKFDPVYLMSLLNQKAIHSNGPDISPSELTDGFVQKFHYINGLVVSQQLKKENDPCRSGNLDRIIELTDELFNEYAMHWIKRPSLDGSHDTKKISEYGAGLTSFLSNLYQPNSEALSSSSNLLMTNSKSSTMISLSLKLVLLFASVSIYPPPYPRKSV